MRSLVSINFFEIFSPRFPGAHDRSRERERPPLTRSSLTFASLPAVEAAPVGAILEAVSKVELGFPHDFLARPTMTRTLRGDLGDKLIPRGGK